MTDDWHHSNRRKGSFSLTQILSLQRKMYGKRSSYHLNGKQIAFPIFSTSLSNEIRLPHLVTSVVVAQSSHNFEKSSLREVF